MTAKLKTITCSIEGCSGAAHRRGWCRKHYENADGRQPCSIEGCDSGISARGWCRRHYANWYRVGDPLVFPAPKPRCTNGHSLSGDNVRIRIRADGRKARVCKTCSRQSVYRIRARRRLERAENTEGFDA